jgi:hypothetical protein
VRHVGVSHAACGSALVVSKLLIERSYRREKNLVVSGIGFLSALCRGPAMSQPSRGYVCRVPRGGSEPARRTSSWQAPFFVAKLSVYATKNLKTTGRRERESLRPPVLANRLPSMLRASTHVIERHASAPGRRLSDDTYRFGFNTIAPGGMADRLPAIHWIPMDRIPFGTDLSVVLFGKPPVARRGYALARAALHEFHQQHPGRIHLSGDIRLQYPAHVHRTVSPRVLAELYNASMAGVSTEIEGLDREEDKQEFVKIIADETFSKKTNARSQHIGSRARNSDL